MNEQLQVIKHQNRQNQMERARPVMSPSTQSRRFSQRRVARKRRAVLLLTRWSPSSIYKPIWHGVQKNETKQKNPQKSRNLFEGDGNSK